VAADQAAYEIRAVDIDLDFDLDLLIAGHSSKNAVWFENPRKWASYRTKNEGNAVGCLKILNRLLGTPKNDRVYGAGIELHQVRRILRMAPVRPSVVKSCPAAS